MRKGLLLPAVSILTVGVLTMWGPLGHRTSAVSGPYSNDAFRGSYAMQFTGEVFVPAPFDKFNGPFFRNARVVADGAGSLDVTAVSNYAGVVARERYQATYSVAPDGTFTVTIVNLPVPFAPGIPNVFTFDGVLADGGRVAKVVLSGVNLGGQQLPNVGSVVTGKFVRQ